MNQEQKINVGDEVVFPKGSMKEKERYKIYEGRVIKITGSWIFKEYSVYYEEDGIKKIEKFSGGNIYKKELVEDRQGG